MVEGLAYGDHPHELLDLQTGSSDVLLMLVHGGGWYTGTRKDGLFAGGRACEVLSNAYGLNVANCDYPLASATVSTAPGRGDPGVVSSVLKACDVAAFAVEHETGRKVRRVVLLGASAGANIACMACVARPHYGFIGFCGAYDLTVASEFRPDVQGMVDAYCGGDDERKRLASPALFKAPPGQILLFHGDADDVISIRQSFRLYAAHGGEMNVLGGLGHSFPIFGTEAEPARWMERIVRFCYSGARGVR